MKRILLAVALASIGFASRPAVAQGPVNDGSDRRVAHLMDRLRDELWSFRQELEFFRSVPDYQRLIELRYQVRNYAIEMAEARSFNEDVRQHAYQMDRAARDMYHLAEHLEDRLDPRNHPEVRRRADSLHEHAVEVRVLVGRLHEVIHLDFQNGAPTTFGFQNDGRNSPGIRPDPRRRLDDRR